MENAWDEILCNTPTGPPAPQDHTLEPIRTLQSPLQSNPSPTFSNVPFLSYCASTELTPFKILHLSALHSILPLPTQVQHHSYLSLVFGSPVWSSFLPIVGKTETITSLHLFPDQKKARPDCLGLVFCSLLWS